MRRLQFGVNLHDPGSTRSDVDAFVRRVDDLGYDIFAAPDHLGAFSPFSVLTAAASVSCRLRLRTYVLNTGFWNAALLAREVATLDVLSGGRVELGLGAGHMKSEHDDAGLGWPPLGQRIESLEQMLLEVRRRLADDDHLPVPQQRPVPVLVGAMSGPGLSVAARHADIVGFSGLSQVVGAPAGTFTIASAAQTRARVEEVRSQAGDRPYRSDCLLQAVVLGVEPAEGAATLIEPGSHLSVERLLDSPFVLLARDADEAADELRRRQQLYGFDSVVTHQPNLEALGEVIAALRRAA